MKLRTVIPLAVMLLVGCSNSPNVCVSSEDCFADEVCLPDGRCGDPAELTEDAGADVATPDADPDDAGPGDDTSTDDPDAAADMSAADSDPSPADMGSDSGGADGTCIEDPFTATCDRPDDNDSFSEYLSFDPSPPGCQGGGDDLDTNDLTVSNLQMCANETQDRYTTNLIPCDTVTYFFEVTVTPRQDCDPDLYTLDVSLGGNDCADPGGKLQCTTMPNGSKKVVAMIEPANALASPNITIGKTNDDAQFDYDLELVVRQ